MTSREKILKAIESGKPEYLPLATWAWESDFENNQTTFIKTLENIGATVSIIKDLSSVKEIILTDHGHQKRIVNRVESLKWNNNNIDQVNNTVTELTDIEVAIIEGKVGVAENGAIWIDEPAMGHRALPFICQHLVILLSIKNIVPTMHHAYARINVSEHGFGTFIAGPSKTADIEQALVIGAHGARSLKVFLIDI